MRLKVVVIIVVMVRPVQEKLMNVQYVVLEKSLIVRKVHVLLVMLEKFRHLETLLVVHAQIISTVILNHKLLLVMNPVIQMMQWTIRSVLQTIIA